MTGKEALKQLEEKYHKYITEWYYMSNMSKEERSRLYSMYDEEIKIIDKELTKYKRAFEILKDRIEVKEVDCAYILKYKGYTHEYDCNLCYIPKEEYELLEELMRDE